MSRLLSLLVGLYGGVYIAQNYHVPPIPGPIGVWEKIKDASKQFEKGNDK